MAQSAFRQALLDTLGGVEPLAPFSPETRAWFERTFSEPTPAQALGWPAIATGKHTLIQAPTGSGKTLAAFLYGIDKLTPEPGRGLRLLYVSPLEAIGRFVSGGREIQLVDAGRAKELDLEIVVPLEDMTVPEEGSYNSVWPSIYPEILKLVSEHRSTIVFVNNRRLAERLALRLNELAKEGPDEPREIARAHHGSVAREQRLEVEELLKKGEIPCLVATSSLELGIDMGAVDLVIQVESPKSVARGLQRIGRAGHELGAVSKGRIFPKFRADLLEAAVVAKQMREGAIEETVIPRNPLDVLAQQIVAICADEEITRDRVLVSPAPGVPGAVPFWRGEGVGRPYELGEAVGAVTRELAALPDGKAKAKLREEHSLDERAAQNLLQFLSEQAAATGAPPSDRTIVVERFRDEIGDWRLCILTPFGARVHAPWGLALAARIRESLGLDANAIWSDDGIAIHLPDADAAPPSDLVLIDPEEIEELVVNEVGDSALFGARFRENAARSLLIPRRRPDQRTPLWQQRLKAQSLLQVARKYPAFPVILETYRECLQDVFDLPSLRRLLQGLRTRQVDVVDVETASASPYSASLLFDYVATYMYEDDTPPAERPAQALSLDRDLLRELLGQEELRDLLDPGALDDVA